MCGIVGVLDSTRTRNRDELHASATAMAQTIHHRGPDSSGVWVDETAGVALGHRRLSILDLSECGAQPMLSATGRYCMVFNGEVYNFADLRAELSGKGCSFRGHSDTEVLLAAFEEWGVEVALQRSVGMFALALWDRDARALFLARDRIGEKPLYYGANNGVMFFGSELKALRQAPGWKGDINRNAVAMFVRDSFVAGPNSIYDGVWKLPPGTYMKWPAGSATVPEPVAYWSLRDVAQNGLHEPFRGSDAEALDELERRLTTAIRGQMVADVPVGAFLSGGIDSSTVVALMRTISDHVRTFSIGFTEDAFNEAPYAKRVADRLGTHHTELYVTSEQARDLIPQLPQIYDEPFADPSQIPTYIVSRLARQHVTVSLSGDGGDELFGGYNRYLIGARLWRRLSPLPAGMRAMAGSAMTSVSPPAWDRVSKTLAHAMPSRFAGISVGDRIHKIAALLSTKDARDLHVRLMSHWPDPGEVMVGDVRDAASAKQLGRPAQLIDEMMFADAMSYLPDDILAKVDRAAMAVSLETRVPLLDHRVVEFAWQLPLAMKVRNGTGKWLLRQLLYRHLPRDLFERPKMGFGVPIGAWLRGPLREWGEELLSERRLRADGFFNPTVVRERWDAHVQGKRNWQYGLWNILMFQAWLTQIREEH